MAAAGGGADGDEGDDEGADGDEGDDGDEGLLLSTLESDRSELEGSDGGAEEGGGIGDMVVASFRSAPHT